MRPVGHDPAVRVREVPLGLWFRHRLLGIGNLRWASHGVFRPVSALLECRSARLQRPPWPPRPSAGLRLPVPPSPPGSSSTGFPAGPTRRGNPPLRPAAATLPLPPSTSPRIHTSVIAHRLVLARVPLHLAPSTAHVPAPAPPSGICTNRPASAPKCRFKFAHRAVVRTNRTQVPKRHILVGPLLDLPRADHSGAVAINQQPHHHHRMVRRLPTPVLLLVGSVVREIQRFQNPPQIAPGDSPVARVTTPSTSFEIIATFHASFYQSLQPFRSELLFRIYSRQAPSSKRSLPRPSEP